MTYERPYSYDVRDGDHSQYRPDFYYPDADLWHEHCALDREGNPPPDFQGYSSGMAWKKSLHRQHGTTLIETTWAGIIDQSGFKPLGGRPQAPRADAGLEPGPTGPRRETGQARGPCSADALVHGAREVELVDPGGPRPATGKGAPGSAEVSLARVPGPVLDIHEEWQRRLAADDSIDFEDMLVQAAEHLESGRTDMGYDLVLVDELQDASQARARLTKALVDKPGRYLLAVGDGA